MTGNKGTSHPLGLNIYSPLTCLLSWRWNGQGRGVFVGCVWVVEIARCNSLFLLSMVFRRNCFFSGSFFGTGCYAVSEQFSCVGVRAKPKCAYKRGFMCLYDLQCGVQACVMGIVLAGALLTAFHRSIRIVFFKASFSECRVWTKFGLFCDACHRSHECSRTNNAWESKFSLRVTYVFRFRAKMGQRNGVGIQIGLPLYSCYR